MLRTGINMLAILANLHVDGIELMMWISRIL